MAKFIFICHFPSTAGFKVYSYVSSFQSCKKPPSILVLLSLKSSLYLIVLMFAFANFRCSTSFSHSLDLFLTETHKSNAQNIFATFYVFSTNNILHWPQCKECVSRIFTYKKKTIKQISVFVAYRLPPNIWDPFHNSQLFLFKNIKLVLTSRAAVLRSRTSNKSF